VSTNAVNSGPLKFPHVKVGELMGRYAGSRGQDGSEFVCWTLNGSELESDFGWVKFPFAGSIAGHGSRGGGSPTVMFEWPLMVDLLAQCPSLPGRQLSQVLLAFTQAHPLQ